MARYEDTPSTDPQPLDVLVAGGDIATALDAAQPHAQVLVEHDHVIAAHRSDRTITTLDLERFDAKPRRQRGTVKALTADGFVAAFKQRTHDPDGEGPAVIYADLDKINLVAVLNDDYIDRAGWRDHRITYEPQHTPEWLHWTGNTGLDTQERFARTLELGETEIVTPSATVMLELAETFHASTSAKFKKAGRRTDGRVQLVYEEEIEATAGEGMVEIPDSFTIRLTPFYGAKQVDVTCKLRYRLDRGDLRIGYEIHRPEEIVRASFVTDVIESVARRLDGFAVVEGVPAPPLTAGR